MNINDENVHHIKTLDDLMFQIFLFNTSYQPQKGLELLEISDFSKIKGLNLNNVQEIQKLVHSLLHGRLKSSVKIVTQFL